MGLVILQCDEAWADRLGVVHAEAFTGGDVWSAASMADLLAGPCVVGLCGIVDDTVAGFVLLQVVADDAEILTIAVARAHRRQGVGRTLMEAALARARQAGAVRMFLDVAAANTGAFALYRALGFAEIAVRPRYYPNGTAAHVLACSLQA